MLGVGSKKLSLEIPAIRALTSFFWSLMPSRGIPRGTDMLLGSLSNSAGPCEQHMASCDWHTRQQDISQPDLIGRVQARTTQADDFYFASSPGNVPLRSLRHRINCKQIALCSRWARATVHHRMVILAMERETSGTNRWLPLVFHVALLYTWPNILLAKTRTFLPLEGHTCFTRVSRVVRTVLKVATS